MKRGRVELKRIENKITRQVTFSKRRNGVLKKAYELSVLCDAEVALIIFSTKGKLFEFCSTSSMLKTLERYQKCSYGPPETNTSSDKALEHSSYQEYLKVKAHYENLQRIERQDLGFLGSMELESLERQIDGTLKKIRSTRTQCMIDQLSDLQQREKSLYQSNNDLQGRLDEGSQVTSLQWDPSGHGARYSQQPTQQLGNVFFHPLNCEPTLQMGFPTEHIAGAPAGPSGISTYVQGWPV
ncbi:hypothetical protein L1049_027844 [Liquidambar formosana]|uniref:Uncharacterized protein n=1 Tax=Liquidambar formosana TaxID=63359 RepID=A0AAP0RI06_LIQFO